MIQNVAASVLRGNRQGEHLISVLGSLHWWSIKMVPCQSISNISGEGNRLSSCHMNTQVICYVIYFYITLGVSILFPSILI